MTSHAGRLRAQIAASREKAGRREADGAQVRPDVPPVGRGWDEEMEDDEALPAASFGGGILGCLRGPTSERTHEQVQRERSLGASPGVLQAANGEDCQLTRPLQPWRRACVPAWSTARMWTALAWSGALLPRWATF